MKKFIKEMLSNQDNISSKRFSGIILIIGFLIITFVSLIIEISKLTANLTESGLLVGAGLLVGGAIEKVWKK